MMKVFKLYYDKDREEPWLNEMMAQGWAFKKFFLGVYTFEKCKANQYTYRIDLMDSFSGTKTSLDYIKFIEETGAEFVDSWGRWAYFRKLSSEGAFDLYTDVDSQIEFYKKIRLMMGVISIAEFVIGFSQLANFSHYGLDFGLGMYLIITLVFALGVAIGIAALKAHFKIMILKKQKGI